MSEYAKVIPKSKSRNASASIFWIFICLLAVSIIEAADSKLSTTKYIMRCNSTKVYWVKRKPATILFSKKSLKVKKKNKSGNTTKYALVCFFLENNCSGA